MKKKTKNLLLCASGKISKTLIGFLSALSMLGFLMVPLTSHAQQTGKVLLKCSSPLDCNLSLDGKDVAVIPAGKLKKVSWEVGEHILAVSVLDNRFSTYVTRSITTVTPLQTVVYLKPYILLDDLLKAAMEGTVVTKTLWTQVGKADGSHFPLLGKIENAESWTNAGFRVVGTKVYILSGASVKIMDVRCFRRPCYVRAQYNNKEFTIFYQELVFIDKKPTRISDHQL